MSFLKLFLLQLFIVCTFANNNICFFIGGDDSYYNEVKKIVDAVIKSVEDNTENFLFTHETFTPDNIKQLYNKKCQLIFSTSKGLNNNEAAFIELNTLLQENDAYFIDTSFTTNPKCYSNIMSRSPTCFSMFNSILYYM